MLKSATLMILMLLITASAHAQFSKGGVHNFTDGIGNDAWFSGEISCSACHTQHGAESPRQAPLWEPEFTDGFLPAFNSDTVAMKRAGLDGITKLCMSCHDGSIGQEIDFDRESGHNHPMGDIYDQKYSSTLVSPSDITLPLSEGRVSCVTCHDPHAESKELLRIDNRRSNLCRHCHAL